MSKVLRHRGPDDEGLLLDGPCGLAHRRLSILDLSSAGRQPMTTPRGTAIAYNGEVYNYRDLRRRHRLDDGYAFRSSTDTEVLLRLYEERGESMLNDLDGMYSFAIWDPSRGTLLLARDPFGIKPLFYTCRSNGIWFASEPKALLEVPNLIPSPSAEALYHFLSLDYIPGDLTAFEGIRELRPGHMMKLRVGDAAPVQVPFFRFRYPEDDEIGEAEAVDMARSALKRAVGRQLISDVPVGVMLSGGMDSSSLTALMADARGNSDFHTFSLAFADADFDESPWASAVAGHLGVRHHRIEVTPELVEEVYESHLCHIDEPYADGSAIPTWLLARDAASKVTVLLSGEGGDEVFAGYDTHAAWRYRRLYRLLPRFLRRGVIAPLARALPPMGGKIPLDYKARRFAEGSEYPPGRSHYYWRRVLGDAEKARLMDVDEEWCPTWKLFQSAWEGCETSSELNRLLCMDLSHHLPDDLMIKNDRMTMAHSVEARVPFTDLGLFREMARVPAGLKMPGLPPKKKQLLKLAMEGQLPGPVLAKKKVGLEMPYSRWLRNELAPMARRELLAPGRLESVGLLRRESVERLWKEHQAGRDHGRSLWGLLSYVVWHRLYIESDAWRDKLNPGVDRGRHG